MTVRCWLGSGARKSWSTLDATWACQYPPDKGLTVFGHLLAMDLPQIMVLPLNLQQWQTFYPEVAQEPLFANLLLEASEGIDQADAIGLAVWRRTL